MPQPYAPEEENMQPIVSPIAEKGLDPAATQATPAPRLQDLTGKSFALVDNSKLNADIFLAYLKERFLSEFGGRASVELRKDDPQGALPSADLQRVQENSEFVLLCYGDCGGSTSWTVRDTVELEARGMPTAIICSEAFARAARAEAEAFRMTELPLVVIPHPMHTATIEMVKERADKAFPSIVEVLTGQHGTQGGDTLAPGAPRTGPSEDTYDDASFFIDGSDGLPVVPPIEERVLAMVAAAGRDPDEILGAVPPRYKPASVLQVAANAVMAGCKPSYFPVVLAAVQATLDDDCHLYSIQTATNASTPLLILNGPIVAKLGVNSGTNVFGSGYRANATIGRAVNLVLQNIGGQEPGVNDMSTHGQPGKYTYCIAENEAANPWSPLHVDQGLSADQSAVSVIGASGPANLFTYGCETGQQVLDHIVGALTGLGHNNIIFGTGPLLILSPEHAGVLARDGFTKQAIRQYVFEHARIALDRFPPRSQAGIRHRRARWFDVAGDHAHIGVADRPEDVWIVVAGGAGIHSQFVSTSFSTKLVTRPVT
jgi:hypothetical protein